MYVAVEFEGHMAFTQLSMNWLTSRGVVEGDSKGLSPLEIMRDLGG